jgi:hypothetical protein
VDLQEKLLKEALACAEAVENSDHQEEKVMNMMEKLREEEDTEEEEVVVSHRETMIEEKEDLAKIAEK